MLPPWIIEDPLKILGPPPPHWFAGPGWTPLRSALRRAWAWAGRWRWRSRAPVGKRTGSLQAEAGGPAGGGCSAQPLGLRLQGLPEAGLSRALA